MDPDIQLFHHEIAATWAYRGTGLTRFRETWESSVERAVRKTLDFAEQYYNIL